MTQVIVVGAQWGDEGKGKIVDWLSSQADVVVRFQGGHNAGHTLVIDGVTYKLSLLPSGIVRPGKLSLLGNGVVVDPWALLEEIKKLKEQNVSISSENFKIADNACLILPVHRDLDHLREESRGKAKIGTTGRGIGPAYEDKVARRAIRFCDLLEPNTLDNKIDILLNYHNALRKGFGVDAMSKEELIQKINDIIPLIKPFITPVWQILDEAIKNNKDILFEGAQGAMLDIDHGTYPFVTSSNTISSQAASGAGIGPNKMNYILGIAKAYTTRVGSGPFPTEQENEIGQTLGEKGHEFGTVTGRQRRCGWFDAIMVRQAVKINGINGIAFTKIDVLDTFEELKICVGYELDGKKIDYFPSGQEAQKSVKPIYETHKGWMSSTAGIQKWEDLPKEAVDYIHRIEELIETKISLVSTSPSREDTILLETPFEDNSSRSETSVLHKAAS